MWVWCRRAVSVEKTWRSCLKTISSFIILFADTVAQKLHSLLLIESKRSEESTAETRENRSHNKPAEKWVRGAQRFGHYSSFLWITQLKEGNCAEALRVSIRQPKEPLCLDKDCVQSRSAGRTVVLTRCGTPAELGNISCKNALDMLLRWISLSHLTVNVLIKPRQLCVCVCAWLTEFSLTSLTQ